MRTTLECTYTRLAKRYRVHELLFEHDQAFGGRPHHNELPGDDIWISDKGCWPNFLMPGEKMEASAVPIEHTVPCVGFIFKEPPRPGSIDAKVCIPILQRNTEALLQPPYNLKNPLALLSQLKEKLQPITLPDGSVLEPPPVIDNGRKLVLLGDTYDAESEAMDSLAMDADFLVHEATNAFLPGLDEAVKEDMTYEEVYRKSRAHGHSTPQVCMAYDFRAAKIHLLLSIGRRTIREAHTSEEPLHEPFQREVSRCWIHPFRWLAQYSRIKRAPHSNMPRKRKQSRRTEERPARTI